MAYVQRRCGDPRCRVSFPSGARRCPKCCCREVAYVVRYRDPDGRERSHSDGLRTRADADRFVVHVESVKAKGEWTDPAGARIRYADWAARWTAAQAGRLRPSTRARNAIYMSAYIEPTFGGLTLGAIKQPAIVEWVGELSAQGLAAATVAKAAQILGASLQAAVDAGLIGRTPYRAVPLPKVERHEMRALSAAEVARLAGCIDSRYRALVLTLAYGGLRIGEAAGLKVGRVDTMRGTITIAETLVEVAGHLTTNGPKTSAGRRVVVLPRPVAEALAEHMASVASNPDAYVFAGPNGGPLRVPAWRQRTWLPAVRRAGLDGLRIHDLRHTAVSLWIEAGGDPKQVAARAGHASVVTILDRYAHVYAGADEQLADRLGAMFEAAPEPQVAPVVRLATA